MKTKKWILFLLTLCIAAALSISVSAAEISTDAVSGEWTYSLSYGEATITGYSGSSTSVTVPSTLDGYTVTGIGSYAFEGCYQIKSITFPKTLQTIGSGAFRNCRGLTEITLPESLTSLGYNAFYDCHSLNKITVHSANLSCNSSSNTFANAGNNVANGIEVIFSDSVTVIPSYIFDCDSNRYARITSVKIGKNVKSIGQYAFDNCSDLNTVSFSSNTPMTSIGYGAFRNCQSLTEITLPESLTSLGYEAFYNCYNLEKITVHSANLSCNSSGETFSNAGNNVANGIEVIFSDSVTVIPSYIFYCDNDSYARITSVKIGKNVKSIGQYAFYNCSDLNTVSLSSNTPMDSIGYGAFRNCQSLTEITLPESLTSLGYDAFYNCYNLEKITVHSANLSCSTSGDTFSNAGKNAANGIEVIFSDSATVIPAYIFDCNKDRHARIANVKVGKNVKSIGQYAFDDCADLKTVSLSANTPVNSIGQGAFRNCQSLTEITLPESLASLGYSAFYNCYNLEKITVHSANLSCSTSGDTFSNAGNNVANGIEVIFSDSVTVIPSYIFYCDNDSYAQITSVKIGKNVKSIGQYAFYNCSDLNTVDIGRYMKLDTIGQYAFRNCTSLTNMTIPSWVTDIGYCAFQNCSSMFRLDVVNPTCKFYNDKNTLGVPGKTVIYGYDGTTTETYADKYGYTFQPISIPFSDVSVPDFYLNPTMWAVDNGITTGTSATTFSPGNECMRAQVVTFLWRAAGSPAPESAVNPFVDVKPSDFYYNAVLWAVENGITNGADATHFNPFGICNRAQVVTFLHRAMGSPVPTATASPFADVPAGSFYCTPVLWAVENGITNGLTATEFGPNSACNRAQVVTFLYRAYN